MANVFHFTHNRYAPVLLAIFHIASSVDRATVAARKEKLAAKKSPEDSGREPQGKVKVMGNWVTWREGTRKAEEGSHLAAGIQHTHSHRSLLKSGGPVDITWARPRRGPP